MRYRVLKSFVNQLGNVLNPEEYYSPPSDNWSPFVSGLIQHGFIEEIKDEPWKPKNSEEYFFLQSDATWNNSFWCNDFYDKNRVSVGNCFQTIEQAKKAAEWLKAFKVLRDDTKGFEPDWSDDTERKFSVGYNHDMGELEIFTSRFSQNVMIYFATEADARESIAEHQHAWFTLFGIEEEE